VNENDRTTEPTHDRGPWHDMGLHGHYRGPEGEFHEIAARDDSRSCSVGRVYVRNANEYARAVARANARLVAAAPDLLAALRMIQNMSIDKEGDAKWTWRDICLECERVARDAIAKAEGK
jgi:hypothetical protein